MNAWRIIVKLSMATPGFLALYFPSVTGAVLTNQTAVVTNSSIVVDSQSYVVSAGDKLNYRVQEDREEPKILAVSPSGEIEVPYLGRVVVAGKTLPQAMRDIKALLEKDLYYLATVTLSVEDTARRAAGAGGLFKPKQVFVVGQVRAQGAQEMPLDEKYMLSRAIIKAGGFGSFANGKSVRVIRKTPEGKTEQMTVDILSVLKKGEVDKDVELQPDDMVIVPEKLVNF